MPAETPPWKKKPKGQSRSKSGKMSEEQVAMARARAEAAGRPYPNLIDNMWAARMGKL